MKRFLILFFIIFCINEATSQNSYVYKGRTISLEPRTDKAAIILNTGTFNRDNFKKNIESHLASGDVLKEAGKNIYLINFESDISLSELQTISSTISSINNLVKFLTPVYYGESRKVTQIPADEIIVRLRNNSDKEKLDLVNVRNNVSIIGSVRDEKGFLLRSNNGVNKNALALADIYFRTELFEYAEPNFVYPEFCLLAYSPNDEHYSQQWSLNNTGQLVPAGPGLFGDLANVNGIPGADIDIERAWDFTTGSSSIKIGVFDTGIDSTHPDFDAPGHMLTGYDACFDIYSVPKDSGFFGGHGTCAAGIVSALINNAVGVSGVAPGCQLMAIRVFDMSGSASSIVLSRAFDTATILGIDVFTNSWVGQTPSSTLTGAIDNATTNGRNGLGCIIFFASGNDGRNSVWYPSYLDNVLSIGASTPHDQKKSPGTGNQFWWGGNYGQDANGDLDLVAPTICYTTDIQGAFGYNNSSGTDGNYFALYNGTSCACPAVAGICALILSANSSLTRQQATEILCRGCNKIDNVEYSTNKQYGKWNEYCGYGRANAYNSVRLAAGVDVTPPTINHKNIISHSSTYPTTVTAEITDEDGAQVPATGDGSPMIHYRINKNNLGWSEFDSAYSISNIGNDFTFQIPCAGHETQVQYYLKAYDDLGNGTTFPFLAPNSFWLCYFAVGTFSTDSKVVSSFTGVDPGATQSPVVNFGNFVIVNSKVEIYLRHNRVSDEMIELFSPTSDVNNGKKCLFASNGGAGADINGAIVSDSAENFWSSGIPSYSNGVFKGDYILKGLNGTNASGDWSILTYDQYPSNEANFDSVKIIFTKTSGIAAPCARLNSREDSVLYFGTIVYPDSVIKDFYLVNVGNANLNVNNVTITGSDSLRLSLASPVPGVIAPGDSGLFSVVLTAKFPDTTHNTDAAESAVLNIFIDDPYKPVFRVSLQTENIILPVELASFTSNVNLRNVFLNWITSHEENNSGFEIFRKNSGNNTNEIWTRIGYVQGHGTTVSSQSYSYEDRNLLSGKYSYRLKQIDFNGNFEYHNLSNDVLVGIPSKFSLSQNFPNPFNPTTKINYDIPIDGHVVIKIFDVNGKELKTLVNEIKTAGYYTANFNGSDFASGVYFYKLSVEAKGSAEVFIAAKKMLLLK